MDNKILVSVIIPVYNSAKYLEDCIQSVQNQTYSNLEIILINDGSSDQSAHICRKYMYDPRVALIDRENKGLSKTRQQGIDLAKGQFFCNLDSDDCLAPEFIEHMLLRALKTGADIVSCGRIDFEGSFKKEYELLADKDIYLLEKDTVSDNIYIYHRDIWLADSWNKMYRTDFVRKTGVKYCLDNKYNGTDLLFNHLIVLHCPKVAVVNQNLLLHRIVLGSRVHRKNKPLQEGFELITEKVFQEAKELDYPAEFFKKYIYCYCLFMKMVFNSIIEESESVNELRRRFEGYCKKRDSFSRKYPTLSSKCMRRVLKQNNRILYSVAMTGNSFFACELEYIRDKLVKFLK